MNLNNVEVVAGQGVFFIAKSFVSVFIMTKTHGCCVSNFELNFHGSLNYNLEECSILMQNQYNFYLWGRP